MERAYFPMFVDITGKKVIVVGGGQIALRRVRTLQKFGADIRVIAPELCEGFRELEDSGALKAEYRVYRAGDVEGADLVIAATDSTGVNRQVYQECKDRGILVNTADDHRRCDFYFPAVVMTEEVVIGINSGGKNPGKVKEVRREIEEKYLDGTEEGPCRPATDPL